MGGFEQQKITSNSFARAHSTILVKLKFLGSHDQSLLFHDPLISIFCLVALCKIKYYSDNNCVYSAIQNTCSQFAHNQFEQSFLLRKMKLSLLFISFHAASSFKLSDFAKVPPELLLLHNDTDANDIDIVDTVINIAANAANVIGDKVKEAKNNKESTNEHEVPLKDNTEDSQEPKEIIEIVEENTSSEILAEETLLKEEDKEAAQEEASEQEENDANKVEVKESLSKEEDQEGENDVEDLKESIKKQVLLETEEKYLTTLKPVPDENLAPDLKLQDSLIDLKSDPDKCPMDDSSDKFQMKLYWTKGKHHASRKTIIC